MNRVIAALVVAAVVTRVAAADEGSPSPAEARERAADHYRRGMTHYNLGKFAEAIVEFEAAYKLSQEPDLLFNIAQAHRLGDEPKQALFFYDAYLRLRPNAANRADVEARIAEAKKLLEDEKSLQTAPPHGAIEPTTPPQKPAVTTPEKPATSPSTPESAVAVPSPAIDTTPHRSPLTIAGWATGAIGIAGVVTGTYFASRASSGWDKLTQLSVERGTWSDHYAGVERDAQRSERLAAGMIVVGAAAIATGGVLWYLGWRRDRPTLAIVPTGVSAEASVSWRF